MTEANQNQETPNLEEIKEKLVSFIETIDPNQFEEFAFIFKLKGQEDPTPQLLTKGHFYDVAAMLNNILHVIRTKAINDLGLN